MSSSSSSGSSFFASGAAAPPPPAAGAAAPAGARRPGNLDVILEVLALEHLAEHRRPVRLHLRAGGLEDRVDVLGGHGRALVSEDEGRVRHEELVLLGLGKLFSRDLRHGKRYAGGESQHPT